jgi:nucleoside-diphosphate-sugar epimerase
MRLITGGTGMLGRNLLESATVRCCFTGRQMELGRKIAADTGHLFVPMDLSTDPLDLLSPVDEIVHCAALSSPWGTPADFERHNVIATEKLLCFALKRKVKRFVYISTPSQYFDFQDHLDIGEGYRPKKWVNHYAASKVKAEALLYSYRHHFDIVVLRPRGIFGKYDNAIVPRLLALSDDGGIPISNDAKAIIDMTHVSNVVHAINLSLALKPLAGRVLTFNITNNEPMRVSDLLALLGSSMGTVINTHRVPDLLIRAIACLSEVMGSITSIEPKLTRYTASLLRYDQTLDISHAQKVLGYEPITRIADGMNDYSYGKPQNDDKKSLRNTQLHANTAARIIFGCS